MKTFTISISVTIDNDEIDTVVQLSEPTMMKDFMQGVDAAVQSMLDIGFNKLSGVEYDSREAFQKEFSELVLTTKKVNKVDIN